jgi:hypothetical protein
MAAVHRRSGRDGSVASLALATSFSCPTRASRTSSARAARGGLGAVRRSGIAWDREDPSKPARAWTRGTATICE